MFNCHRRWSNAPCSRWLQNGLTNTTGQETDSLISRSGNKQIIDQPTHVLNKSTSWIDLLFRTNQNIISNYRVDVSIYDNCLYNIIFGKINVLLANPPVYIREVWNYSQANVEISRMQNVTVIGVKLLKIFP